MAEILTWRGEGWCRRCRSGTVESIELPHPVLARSLSPAELAEPALFDRRRQAAAELVAARTVRPGGRLDRYRIDYLEPDRQRVPAVPVKVVTGDFPAWLRRDRP